MSKPIVREVKARQLLPRATDHHGANRARRRLLFVDYVDNGATRWLRKLADQKCSKFGSATHAVSGLYRIAV